MYLSFPTEYDATCKDCRTKFSLDKEYEPVEFRMEVMNSWLKNHDCVMKPERICKRATR